MRRVSFLTGVVVASCLAGLMLLVPPLVFDAVVRPERLRYLGSVPTLLLTVIPVGFVFAFPFNLVGAASLALAGRDRPAFRRWELWLLVGATVGGVLGLLVRLRLQTTPFAFGTVAAVALLGTANAGICRWFTRWRN